MGVEEENPFGGSEDDVPHCGRPVTGHKHGDGPCRCREGHSGVCDPDPWAALDEPNPLDELPLVDTDREPTVKTIIPSGEPEQTEEPVTKSIRKPTES